LAESYQTLRPRDIRFDQLFGIETDDYVEVDEFDIDNKQHSERYVPTYVDVFLALEPLFPQNIQKFNFVDIGAGKGRVVLLASHFAFKKVIGIEFVPKLYRIMTSNISNYDPSKRHCGEIEAIFGNALNYDFPNDNTVFFLFNPMKREALSVFVDRMAHSYLDNPREILVLFLNPNPNNNAQEIFENAGLFTVEFYDTPEFEEVSPLPLLVCKTRDLLDP
jgi:SAM-dependent methyltransferase